MFAVDGLKGCLRHSTRPRQASMPGSGAQGPSCLRCPPLSCPQWALSLACPLTCPRRPDPPSPQDGILVLKPPQPSRPGHPPGLFGRPGPPLLLHGSLQLCQVGTTCGGPRNYTSWNWGLCRSMWLRALAGHKGGLARARHALALLRERRPVSTRSLHLRASWIPIPGTFPQTDCKASGPLRRHWESPRTCPVVVHTWSGAWIGSLVPHQKHQGWQSSQGRLPAHGP